MIKLRRNLFERSDGIWFGVRVFFMLAVMVLAFGMRPSPASANLVINGDFENGTAGWTGGEMDRMPHWGEKSLFVQDTSPTECNTAMSIDPISISPGSKYLFQVWIHGDTSREDVQVGIYQYDASDKWISSANRVFDVSVGRDWTLFKDLIEDFHHQAAGVRIFLRPAKWTQDGSGMGAAWFDDVSFDRHDVNLVENGGFENGLTGWTGGGTASSAYAHSGTRSLEINDASMSSTIEEGTTAYIPILKDRTYLLDFWARGTRSDQTIQVTVSPFYEDGKGNIVRAKNMDIAFAIGTGWSQISYLVEGFPPEAEWVKLYVRPAVYTSDGYLTGKAYFDDVYFGLHDGNLLFNAGFEYGAAGWAGGRFRIDSQTVHGGTGALLFDDANIHVMAPAPTPNPDLWAQSQGYIPIHRGSIYLFQAWARGTMSGQSVSLAVKQFDGNKQYLRYADIQDSLSVGPTWSQSQRVLEDFHQDAAYVQVHLSLATWAQGDEGERQIWFDDVMWIPYEDSLIENGNLERGLMGWVHGELTSSSHDGKHALKMEDASASANVEAYMDDLIPLARDGAYTFAAWYNSVSSEPIQMSINQYDGNGNWISGANKNYYAPGSSGAWACTQFTVSGFQPSAAWVRPYLRPNQWTSAGEKTGIATFDQVVFRYEQVPQEGFWIEGSGGVPVWWSPADQKIQRGLILRESAPRATSARVYAARGERESFQLVLVPSEDVRLSSARVSALVGPGTITADNVSLREVAYVPIKHPTDYWEFAGCEMPDPLPTLGQVDIRAGEQQPIWVTINVPSGTPAGLYRGNISFSVGGKESTVPIDLEVWDFDMPVERHLGTAFGTNLDAIDYYHHLAGDRELRRQVLQLYLQSFAEQRVSPYNSVGDDWYDLLFYNLNWVGGNFVSDSDPSHGSVLQVDDTNSGDGDYMRSTVPIAIDVTMNYQISWDVKVGGTRNPPDTDYAIVIEQYNGSNQWISGKNIVLVANAPTADAWHHGSQQILDTAWSSDARYIYIFLYARSTRDAGATGTAWYDNLSFTVESSTENLVQNPGFDPVAPADLDVRLTKTDQFDDAAEFAFNLGIDSLRIGLPNFSMITASTGVSKPSLLGWQWGTTEYQQAYPNVVRAIAEHLRSKGWLDEAYAYWIDEPSLNWQADMDYGNAILEAGAPDLNRLIVSHYLHNPNLVESNDLWTSGTIFYDSTWGQDFRGKGKETWWYVWSNPRRPFANFLLDYPGIDIRSFYWSAWKYGIQGTLYWETTYWTPDAKHGPYHNPWQDGQSYSSDALNPFFGNGDGRLLYPPRNWDSSSAPLIEAPVPSIRWELIREGIEDYEYFWLLRDAKDRRKAMVGSDSLVQKAEGLLDLPASIVASLTSYSKLSADYSSYRNEVAQTLVSILQELPSPTPMPTPTMTSLPSVTPLATATFTPSVSSTASGSPSPSATSTRTPGPTPTFTPIASRTPVPSASSTRTPGPTPTSTPIASRTPTATSSPVPTVFFVDVPETHWAYEDIKALYEAGYVAGCNSEGPEYCPEDGLQRDQTSVIVVRGANGSSFYPDEPTQQPFADVFLGVWHAKWIARLLADSYTAGCGENAQGESIFCPYQTLTRAELTVFALRTLLGPDYAPAPLNPPREVIYDDVPNEEVGQWYPKWIYDAYDRHLIQDCEDELNRLDNSFRPLEIATRAEMACMMSRALGLPYSALELQSAD